MKPFIPDSQKVKNYIDSICQELLGAQKYGANVFDIIGNNVFEAMRSPDEFGM